MSAATETFAQAAREFRSWVEREPGNAAQEAATARRLLAALYHLALELPRGSAAEYKPAVDEADWERVYRRFGTLPFNHYSTVDPLEAPVESVMTGDLADDLADICCELTAGLRLHESGQATAAAHHWGFSFRAHWASHAAEALHALQAWADKPSEE